MIRNPDIVYLARSLLHYNVLLFWIKILLELKPALGQSQIAAHFWSQSIVAVYSTVHYSI